MPFFLRNTQPGLVVFLNVIHGVCSGFGVDTTSKAVWQPENLVG
jgi:hypothetical protein